MPRRVSRKSRGRRAPARTREPLAEGLLTKRGREWNKMSDKELVAFAKELIRKNGIRGRGELAKADGGLYYVLGKRKLLERVGFEEIRRNWGSFSDAQLVKHTRKFMKEKGISGRMDLYKEDSGLYYVLGKRKLLDRAGFEEKQRNWISFSDAQLVENAKKFMEEKGISGRGELQKADSGLYRALRLRKLLDKIDFEEKQRNWKSLSDERLVEHARQSMEEKGISGRTELEKADSGLYGALRKRKLLGKVGFEEKRQARPRGFFSQMSDGELVAYAQKFMKEKGINGRNELLGAVKGLYSVLLRRKLLDRIGFEEKQRNWASLSDAELVKHVRQFMEVKEIRGRREMEKADRRLYSVLLRRKLLDKVGFEEKKRDWASMSDEKLVAHAKEFMKEKGIRARKKLKKADGGLYETLRTRKLLDNVGLKKIQTRPRGFFSNMSDAELVTFAKELIRKNWIKGRGKLQNTDRGLYYVLRTRKLLDIVFEDIEKAKEREEAQALFDGLAEFGGAQ